MVVVMAGDVVCCVCACAMTIVVSRACNVCRRGAMGLVRERQWRVSVAGVGCEMIA